MQPDPQTDEPTRREIDYLIGQAGGCEGCGSIDGVDLEPGRTCYTFDGEVGSIDDPNRSMMYCRKCAEMHHEHWDAMWAEYYASQG